MARLRAVVTIHPAGFGGMPSRGQRSGSHDKRVLHGVLGDGDVTEDANQSGHGMSVDLTEDAVDLDRLSLGCTHRRTVLISAGELIGHTSSPCERLDLDRAADTTRNPSGPIERSVEVESRRDRLRLLPWEDGVMSGAKRVGRYPNETRETAERMMMTSLRSSSPTP